MLALTKGKPEAQRVLLGKDAWIEVRPATQFELEEAHANVSRMLAGIIAGSEAADALSGVLGDDFDVDGLKNRARLAAASARLADIYLVMACQEGWTGIGAEDGTPFAQPEPWSVGLLLNDPMRRAAVMVVVNSSVHREIAEGEGLPASPHGGAGVRATAPNAAPAASPAPMD
jgi:hypothetical protein